MFLSSTGHVKPRVNLRRPLRKAKYSMSTDSELVPGVIVRGKLKSFRDAGAAKASPNRAFSRGLWTRSGGDLPMARLKQR